MKWKQRKQSVTGDRTRWNGGTRTTGSIHGSHFLPIVLLVAVVTGPLVAMAPGDVFDHPVSDGSRPALEEAVTRLSRYPVLRGRFEQKKEIRRLSRTLRSEGNFLVSREEGLVFETEKPFPSTTIIGENFFVQRRGSSEESVLDAGENPVFLQFSRTIRATFSGDTETLFRRFHVYYRESQGRSHIGLIPRDGTVRSVIASMEIVGTDTIETFIITEPSEDVIRYTFSDHSFSEDLCRDEAAYFHR